MIPMRWIPLLALLPAALGAQDKAGSAGSATVRVMVRDSVSGRPIARAGIHAEGRIGLSWTDSTGRSLMKGVPRSSVLIVRCPAERRLAGRVVLRRPLALQAGADTQVTVGVDAATCAEPPVTSVSGEFRGHFTSGFESSDFRPCNGLPPEARVYDDSWGAAWVRFSKEAEKRPIRWPTSPDSEAYPTIFVRWRGTLTGPGAYGHLGVAAYEFVVDEILEVRRSRRSDCR